MARLFIKSLEDDIFEMYPQLMLVSDYADLIEELGREKAGNILKGIYFIYDPKSDLKDSGMSRQELVGDINKNLIGDEEFDWDEYDYLVQTYLKVSLNKVEKVVARYEEELDGFDALLKSWKWTKKDASAKAGLMAKYNTMSEKLIELREKVKVGKEDMSQSYGGYNKSLIESM